MKILSLLTQSKESKEQKAAERAARTLERGQQALIDRLEASKDELTAKKENLLELDAKKISDEWNDKFQNILVELELIDVKIKLANKTLQEYFTTVEATK